MDIYDISSKYEKIKNNIISSQVIQDNEKSKFEQEIEKLFNNLFEEDQSRPIYKRRDRERYISARVKLKNFEYQVQDLFIRKIRHRKDAKGEINRARARMKQIESDANRHNYKLDKKWKSKLRGDLYQSTALNSTWRAFAVGKRDQLIDTEAPTAKGKEKIEEEKSEKRPPELTKLQKLQLDLRVMIYGVQEGDWNKKLEQYQSLYTEKLIEGFKDTYDQKNFEKLISPLQFDLLYRKAWNKKNWIQKRDEIIRDTKTSLITGQQGDVRAFYESKVREFLEWAEKKQGKNLGTAYIFRKEFGELCAMSENEDLADRFKKVILNQGKRAAVMNGVGLGKHAPVPVEFLALADMKRFALEVKEEELDAFWKSQGSKFKTIKDDLFPVDSEEMQKNAKTFVQVQKVINDSKTKSVICNRVHKPLKAIGEGAKRKPIKWFSLSIFRHLVDLPRKFLRPINAFRRGAIGEGIALTLTHGSAALAIGAAVTATVVAGVFTAGAILPIVLPILIFGVLPLVLGVDLWIEDKILTIGGSPKAKFQSTFRREQRHKLNKAQDEAVGQMMFYGVIPAPPQNEKKIVLETKENEIAESALKKMEQDWTARTDTVEDHKKWNHIYDLIKKADLKKSEYASLIKDISNGIEAWVETYNKYANVDQLNKEIMVAMPDCEEPDLIAQKIRFELIDSWLKKGELLKVLEKIAFLRWLEEEYHVSLDTKMKIAGGQQDPLKYFQQQLPDQYDEILEEMRSRFFEAKPYEPMTNWQKGKRRAKLLLSEIGHVLSESKDLGLIDMNVATLAPKWEKVKNGLEESSST